VILDEVQRVPDLFPAIKLEVDRNRQPGRFLLTGSANVMLLPTLSESLAGRMEIHTLWPLSQGEIIGQRKSFIDLVFNDGGIVDTPAKDSEAWTEQVCTGGYPEVLARKSESRRGAWLDAYLTTIVQRDVRDIANIADLTVLPRLLTLLASRACSLLNYADLSRSMGIPQTTLKRYLALLETTFLVQPLPAWSANLGQRLIKSPKVILSDTGLLTHLMGYTKNLFVKQRDRFGPVFENYVVMELRKQLTWSSIRTRMYYFRTASGIEVDILLENAAGRCVAIEVKATGKVDANDFKGIRLLAQALGDRFLHRIVLYLGRISIPFSENTWALPLGALWS